MSDNKKMLAIFGISLKLLNIFLSYLMHEICMLNDPALLERQCTMSIRYL